MLDGDPLDPVRAGGGPDIAGPALSIVIPVYDEGENIRQTLRGIAGSTSVSPLEILVVYDFDEDTTVPVVKELQAEIPAARLHKNEIGRGVDNAPRSGLAAARAPHVLVTMADLSDNPRDIDAMYEPAKAGAAELSLHYVGEVPTHDPTNNFKIYSRQLLDAVRIQSAAGFEMAIELTVKAYLLGMRVSEVPTTWRDRTAGQKRFQTRKWIPHYLRWYRRGIIGRFRRR